LGIAVHTMEVAASCGVPNDDWSLVCGVAVS
jgi:hypothetical protein